VVVLTKTNVINTSDSLVNCKVKTNIVDKDNNIVAIAETVGDVPANGSYEFNSQTTRIVNPDLWHPDNPYMYKAYTQVIYNDENVDEYITPIGLRWIEFSSKDGKFYINNKYLKLRGLDRHETFPY
ncbi:beta-galactosidase, partial [Clostridium perfringens]|nr:beta-galactosidase [Clostridium perfringens]